MKIEQLTEKYQQFITEMDEGEYDRLTAAIKETILEHVQSIEFLDVVGELELFLDEEYSEKKVRYAHDLLTSSYLRDELDQYLTP